jgi:2-C-methyl-D-erythritol 4-phosphate cytidylyltransferase
MSLKPINTDPWPAIFCVIPAAGVGKRMKVSQPKQYLTINDKTILQHTVDCLCSVPFVQQVVIAINPQDAYFEQLGLENKLEGDVKIVFGGDERVNSVLAGLKAISDDKDAWVLVHDAARPNVCHQDIQKLVSTCLEQYTGGILATPVRDTMKRGDQCIDRTESRDNLWHALTPQFFPLNQLIAALEQGLASNLTITDEASAIENTGERVLLVEGRSDNLKITRPEDLALATFYLNQTL